MIVAAAKDFISILPSHSPHELQLVLTEEKKIRNTKGESQDDEK